MVIISRGLEISITQGIAETEDDLNWYKPSRTLYFFYNLFVIVPSSLEVKVLYFLGCERNIIFFAQIKKSCWYDGEPGIQ